MTAIALLARAELRRSWRPLLGIALVVVVGCASVMLALAGARRADTAFERFRASVADGHVFVGIDEAPERLSELDRLPNVRTVAPFGYVGIHPVEAPAESGIEGGGFASLDGRWLYDVQRPRVLDGQMPAADAAAQMVVNEKFADLFGSAVGDIITMEAATAAAFGGVGDPAAVVTVDVEITGVVRTTLDIGVNVGGPIAYFPPGFLRANPEIGYARGFALLVLVGGDASFAELQGAAAEAFEGEPSFTTGLISEEGRTIERALDVQVTALLVVAIVTGIAGAALLLQVTSRRVRRAAEANEPLRSIGASRAQRVAILAVPMLIAVLVGLVVAIGSSVALTSLVPRGLARVAEPDPGPYVDRAVIAGVGASVLGLAAAFVLGPAVWATRVSGHLVRSRVGRGERAILWLQGAGAGLPFVTGLRLALPSRTTDRTLGGFASLGGLVVGLAGLIAATSFGAKLTDVAVDSGAWGTPFDLYAGIDGRGAASTIGASQAAAIPGVSGVTTAHYAEVLDLGEAEAPGYGVRADEGELAVTAVKGRPPATAAEVLLGSRTARELGVGLDDTLRLPLASSGSVTLTVVGLGLLPLAGDGTYDDGVVVLADTFDRLRHDADETSLWLGLEEGADVERVTSALSDTGADVYPIEPPSEQRNLQMALSYPDLVGIIVAVLALAGLGNAILSGAADRRLELATLRAIGFTGRQVRASIVWQSLAVGLAGLTVGIPLGLIATNAMWGTFADSLFLDRSLAVPWGITSVVAVGLVIVAGGVALPIGRALALRPLAGDLHTE